MMGWTRNSRKADSRIVEAKSGIGRLKGRPGRQGRELGAAKRAIVARATDSLDLHEPGRLACVRRSFRPAVRFKRMARAAEE
jgi:hypothetical protein